MKEINEQIIERYMLSIERIRRITKKRRQKFYIETIFGKYPNLF